VQYMKLTRGQQQEMLQSLTTMKAFLSETFASLTPDEARAPGPNGLFSPVEQVWHLADLEREGFGIRISRLRAETDPHLPDFDGAKIAQERDYKSLSLYAGLRSFESARQANIAVFKSLPAEAWNRSGTQDGVGPVSLCDMPALMQQHDQAHRAEIEEWRRSR